MKPAAVGAMIGALGLAGLATASRSPRGAQQPVPEAADPAARPALVVLVTVDQMRPDYVDRFAGDLTGGFARLAARGTFFPDARQDHAMTSTAPGHATLWSGRVPAHTGIVSNDLGVPDPAQPLIGAAGPGASPARFHGTALYDWIARADPGARMLSVSRKDRGAILPAGAARVAAFWWAAEGRLTTSTFYADSLPTWVSEWNARFAKSDWNGRAWTPLLPARAYPERDDAPWEGTASGFASPAFPHRLGSVRELDSYPWMDSLTIDAALEGARAMELGRRGSTDVLAVSLSTLDAVGHAFGPDSREVHDHFVRLDRWLGAFMDALDHELGAGRVLYVVSADHGIGSMPEATGRGGRVQLGPTISAFLGAFLDRGVARGALQVQDGLVLADTAALRAAGLDPAQLADDLAARLRALPGVQRVYTPRALAAAAASDEGAQIWRRSIPPEYGWLAALDPAEGFMLGGKSVAQHGTSLEENRRVPLFFLGAGIPARRVARLVRTVDVAPTVAALLGIRPLETVDGVPLTEVLPPS